MPDFNETSWKDSLLRGDAHSGFDINACPTAQGKLEVGPDKLFQKELAQRGK